jgi:uncharacterized protein YuzE
MQSHYDPDSNIVRLEITSGEIAYAKEINGTILHMNTTGLPVYIEILDAGSLITKLGKLKDAGSITPAPKPSS